MLVKGTPGDMQLICGHKNDDFEITTGLSLNEVHLLFCGYFHLLLGKVLASVRRCYTKTPSTSAWYIA